MRASNLLITSFALGLTIAPAGITCAQSNTLVIEQGGDANTLTIDQSGASNSSVAGLEQTSSRQSFDVQYGTETVQDTAEDGIVTMREVPLTRTDTLDVLTFRGTDSARQTGSGNSASITMTGDGGAARLLQDNSAGGLGNSATIVARLGSNAAVGQVGFGNSADVNVDGGLSGTILQSGNGNKANLSVTGSGSSGLISQVGDGNSTVLGVTGVGTSVSYTLQGNGLSPASPEGMQVTTNNASVQITQTALPGIGTGR